MQNNRKLIISVGQSRKAKDWKAAELFWSEFVEKLRIPQRSTETIEEYKKLPKAMQDELKDVGGFVGGQLNGTRRKSENVLSRCLITLDMDSIPAGQTEEILKRVEGLGCAYVVYSTRKHEPAAPRLRVIIPADRDLTADEYEPAARKTAALIGIEFCDPTTFDVSRLMYWPSCCSDSEYIFDYGDKAFVSADGLLGMYGDWRNVSEWPIVPGAAEHQKRNLKRQTDPTTKTGIIGAFCRVYDVPAAMEKFLPGVYEPLGEGRYTYTGGSTVGGAVLYDDGKFLYSHHATDPAQGRTCNSFDLVRIHKFGYLDEEAKPDTFTHQLPSTKEMTKFAHSDSDANKEYLATAFSEPLNEDLVPFHKIKNGIPVGVFDLAIVKDIVEKKEFFIMGDTFFVYVDGVYREDRKGLTVKGWIMDHIYPKFITTRAVNGIYQLLAIQREKQKNHAQLNQYPDYWINFSNGMFDFKNWQLHSHDPGYFSINQIPHVFTGEEPKSTGAIEKFLAEAIRKKDDIEMLFQYAGYCFTKSTKFESLLLLYGTGGTGKSVLISLIIEAVGYQNTSSISMQKLNERFYAVELMGKLLNACADIPGEAMKSIDIIKQLVTGDLMTGERKGQDPFDFKNTAKLLFSGNALPLNLDESTDAFYRRLLILRMDNAPKYRDPYLSEKLKGDIDYFIYRSVKAIGTALLLGGIRDSERSREEVKKLYKYSDSVAAFLADCTVTSLGTKIERAVLYNAYQGYCYANDRRPITRNGFYKNLRESKKIREFDSSGKRGFKDIELLESSFSIGF